MKKFKFNTFFQMIIAVGAILFLASCEELALDYYEQPGQDTTAVGDTIIEETDSTEVTDSTDVPGEEEIDITTPTACEACDHIVNGYITDGKELNIQPGDLICIAGGETYSRLLFRNIVGTPDNPVIIRNCGGVASIYSKEAFGIKFEHSKDFRLSGDGSADKYGLKVTTEKGFYVTMEKFTTDFEISRLEITSNSPNGLGDNAGFAGIGIKTSPYQDCNLFSDPTRKAWIMRNIYVHDNYIHDIGGEGLYVGHGMYKGRVESGCSQMTYSHSIQHVRIYNNLIENVGYDGIQIKNADKDVEVYGNVIRNYGTKNKSAHDEGLFIGEGAVGKYYNNLVDTGTGNGCSIQGMGNIEIFNNVFANQGTHGIYIAHGSQVVRMKDAPFNIFNNTIYNSGDHGYVFHNNDGGPKRFINNLVVKAKMLHKEKDATTEKYNNIFTNDESMVRFVNSGLQNYRLSAGSAAIDAGADLRSFGIEVDWDGVARPKGNGFDIGAFEF